MRSLRLALPALVLSALALAAAHAPSTRASAGETYTVYCVNGKIEFGTRPLKDMQWDYGANVCELAKFDSYQSAREDARRRGGVGAACSCK